MERHRHLWLFLQRHTDFFAAPLKVLHIAPEDCLQPRFKALTNLDYLSGDLAADNAMTFVDVTALAFADETFDVILCSHVLEHVADDVTAVAELMRVLKSTGWAVLDAPVYLDRESTYEDWTITEPQDRERAFGQFDHVRVYGRDYLERLRTGGADVTVDPMPMSKRDHRRYGLHPLGHIYFCRPATATDS